VQTTSLYIPTSLPQTFDDKTSLVVERKTGTLTKPIARHLAKAIIWVCLDPKKCLKMAHKIIHQRNF
jgi:hypothetical protein